MNRSTKLLNIVGVALIVYLAIIVFQTIKRNYDLNRQITQLQTHITDLTNQQAELQYEVSYYQTNSFKEKAARTDLGLMQPGEGVIVLPKTSPQPAPAAKKASSKPKSNPSQWWEFLFG